MRAIFIVMASIVLSVQGQTLIDSYSESNQSTAFTLSSVVTAKEVGQVFTNTNAATLGSCKFYVKKTGAPTGYAYAYIYAITGTYGSTAVPTGSALATSDAFDVSTLSTSYSLGTFTFSGANQISLSASTYYAISCRYESGDFSNNIQVGSDNTSSTHSGNFIRNNSGTWAGYAQDAPFYVYTTAGVSSQIKAINAVTQATISKLAGVTMSGVKKFNGVANQ